MNTSDSQILKPQLLKKFSAIYPSNYFLTQLEIPLNEQDDVLNPNYMVIANDLNAIDQQLAKTYVRNIWNVMEAGIYQYVRVDNSSDNYIGSAVIELDSYDLIPIYNHFVNEIKSLDTLIKLLFNLSDISKLMKLRFVEVSPCLYLFYANGFITSALKSVKQNYHLFLATDETIFPRIHLCIARIYEALEYSLTSIFDEYSQPSEQQYIVNLKNEIPELLNNSIYKDLSPLEIKAELKNLIADEQYKFKEIMEGLVLKRPLNRFDTNDKQLVNKLSSYLKINGKSMEGNYFKRETFSYQGQRFTAEQISKIFLELADENSIEPLKLKLFAYGNFYQLEMKSYAQEIFPEKQTANDFYHVTEQAQKNYSLKKICPLIIQKLNCNLVSTKV